MAPPRESQEQVQKETAPALRRCRVSFSVRPEGPPDHELGHRLECVLRGSGEHEPIALQLDLIHRNRDEVLADETEEPAHSNDRVRHRAFRRDDDVFDLPDLLTLVVVHGRVDQFVFGAPAKHDDFQLFDGDAERCASGDLGRAAPRHGKKSNGAQRCDMCVPHRDGPQVE